MAEIAGPRSCGSIHYDRTLEISRSVGVKFQFQRSFVASTPRQR